MNLARLGPALSVSLAAVLASGSAAAFPGFFVGKDAKKRVIHETHVAVMLSADRTAVTVMPDFDGPMESFAVVIPVPADVTIDRVKTMRREFIDRIDVISAPRYHEFWEMDPCEPGPPEQEWERNMKANSATAFLGGFEDKGATKKVDKEMFVKVEPQFKEGEYTFTLLSAEDSKNAGEVLKRDGWVAPPGALEALKRYTDAGMNVLIGKVDTNKIELTGGGKGILSPIRFWTTSYGKIPLRLGLANADGKQEVVLYVLHADKRYEVKNYPNVVAPTNINTKLDLGKNGDVLLLKERMGELWAAMHDRLLAQNPKAFILQYAWHSKGCGQPCPNDALMPSEFLTLGADVFEEALPEEVRHPEPPEMTEEEKKSIADAGAKGKKEAEEERKEVARRKALIERLQYVVTRVHHRYDASTLTDDVDLGPADPLQGGVDIPKTQKGEIPLGAKPAQRNMFQTRFMTLHPWKAVTSCDKPERWRWGKSPREYRGLRRIWVAQDTAIRDRKEIKLEEVILTAIPTLGLSGVPVDPDAGVDGGTEEAAKAKKGCGCETPRGGTDPATPLAATLLGFAVLARRRRNAQAARRSG